MCNDIWYCWVCDESYSDGYHDESKHEKCLENIKKNNQQV